LDVVTQGYNAAGRFVGWIVIALIAGYFVFRAWLWIKGRSPSAVEFTNPVEVARDVAAGAFIYDVRSHGYFDAKAIRIRGSRRLDPNALHQSEVELPSAGPVHVYCTCARQATSTRVAGELQSMLEGKRVRVTVIKGGLRAWVKAGLPVEDVPRDEMAALPIFE
jgi:rhodanese-related sulfurtransferase